MSVTDGIRFLLGLPNGLRSMYNHPQLRHREQATFCFVTLESSQSCIRESRGISMLSCCLDCIFAFVNKPSRLPSRHMLSRMEINCQSCSPFPNFERINLHYTDAAGFLLVPRCHPKK